jgi:hypothetical protein
MPAKKTTGTSVIAVLHIPITRDEYEALDKLTKGPAFGPDATPEDVIAHMITCAIDGARREGSWEHLWCQTAGLLAAFCLVAGSALNVVGCSGAVELPDAAAASATSSSGAGGADAGCEPCSALHLCVGSCHPAGTPPSYCEKCGGK